MKKKIQDIRISVVYLSSADLLTTSLPSGDVDGRTYFNVFGNDVRDERYDYQAPSRIFQ